MKKFCIMFVFVLICLIKSVNAEQVRILKLKSDLNELELYGNISVGPDRNIMVEVKDSAESLIYKNFILSDANGDFELNIDISDWKYDDYKFKVKVNGCEEYEFCQELPAKTREYVNISKKTEFKTRVVFDVKDKYGKYKLIYTFAKPLAIENVSVGNSNDILFASDTVENDINFWFNRKYISYEQENDYLFRANDAADKISKGDIYMVSQKWMPKEKTYINISRTTDEKAEDVLFLNEDNVTELLDGDFKGFGKEKQGISVPVVFSGNNDEYINVSIYMVAEKDTSKMQEGVSVESLPFISYLSEKNNVIFVNIGNKKVEALPIIKDEENNVILGGSERVKALDSLSVDTISASKVFLWSDLEKLVPLAEVVEVK